MTQPSLNTVLVVDDDPVLCDLAVTHLRNAGVSQIEVAHNGEDALEIVKKHDDPLDFILLDLKMPVMDGIQFLSHMHKHSYPGPIGIISGEGEAIVQLAIKLAKKQGLNIVGSLLKPLKKSCLDALLSSSGNFQTPSDHGNIFASVVNELEAALDRDEIVAHYQPQIDALTGVISGVEALARWNHPDKGLIPPGVFIPVAEDHGLMSLLTDRMIRNVISDIGFLDRISPRMTISINLGAAVLNDTAFPDTLTMMIDQCGQSRTRFILELTESKLVEDSVASLETLARLDLSGFELSLDDFGTQFSNIEQLTKYPFKELKIDRSFVQSVATNDLSKVTVDSCLSLGRQLGMRIVAEGVETDECRSYLTNVGVDILQGFLIAQPMSIDDLVVWSDSYPPDCELDGITLRM